MFGVELSPVFLLIGFLKSCAVSRKYSSLCFQSHFRTAAALVLSRRAETGLVTADSGLKALGTQCRNRLYGSIGICEPAEAVTLSLHSFIHSPTTPMPQIKGTRRRPNMPNNCTNGEHLSTLKGLLGLVDIKMM